MKMDVTQPREQQVYNAIIWHYSKYAVPPTIRNIIDLTDITSTSMVNYYYKKLVKANLIELVSAKPIPSFLSALIKFYLYKGDSTRWTINSIDSTKELMLSKAV